MSRCELSRAQAVFERQAAACCDVLCAREARFVGESNVATSGKNYEQSQKHERLSSRDAAGTEATKADEWSDCRME